MKRSFELSEYAGRPYHLVIRGEPDLTDPDEFAVTVYYNDPERGSSIPVARIDTDHGQSHLDKLFLEDAPKEWMDIDLWDAVDYLIDHHPEYARKHRDLTER
ncbi:hypothetical protein SAMN04515672_0123 [Natronorubrum texcoconense]|uniref:DUF7718 domain-containing protein n=1 Tax=Natronorubrum texcoconense TaxID=1095776 RepID=A0A1G9H6R0_9EURY|nr:hypothetical protein SAMN04515672_0123 [Natronorubrum texcoconense]